jgi:autotransporter-associated beta strand protein
MAIYKFVKDPTRGYSSKLSKVAIALCTATLVGAAANAAATYDNTADDGATLVVTVDSDGATLDASQVVAGITKIVKRGAGKLTATPISSYTGDFDIEEGIWCCTAAGDFGATSTTADSGTIWVRDGASIEYAGSNKYPGTLSGKTVHLYGSAASGATSGSKIFLSANTQMADPGLGKNFSLFLHDDATIYSRNRLCLVGTYDLGGKALTIAGGSGRSHDVCGTFKNGGHIVIAAGTTWMSQAAAFVFDAECADQAYVEIESGATFNIKDKVTVANGWTVRNNGGTITCNTQRMPTTTDIGSWEGPIELSGSTIAANYGTSIGGWGISNTVLNVKGPISGTGTLSVGPGWLNLHNAENTYSGAVTVRGRGTKRTAGSNENVVPPGAGGIGIWNGATAFTSASSITLKDSARVEFMDEVAASVGALTFVGDTSTFTNGDPGDDTQSIKGGSAVNRSTIAGLTKTGTNTLVVGTTAHFTGTATISEGVLKIPYRSTKGMPGLMETHITPISPGDPKWDDAYVWAGSGWNGTNNKWPISRPWLENYRQHLNYYEKGVCAIGPRCGLRPMINNENKGNPHWSDGYSGGRNGWWYRGYVWNNSDEPVTYTFWSGLTGNAAAIYFGEDHDMLFFSTDASSELYTEYSVKPAAAKSYTFQPGATPVDIVVWANGGSSTIWSYGLPSNGERYGLVFAPSSVCTAEALNAQIVAFYNDASTTSTNTVRDTLRQFSEFRDDSGIGTLFTADIYSDADADKKGAMLPVFDDLKFENGTKLDLDGNLDFVVKNLTGSPEVVNAVRMTVTNNLTICAADFPKADSTVRHPMTVDGKLVFAEGATFSIDDESLIERTTSGIVVATATDGIVGTPKVASGHAKKWKLKIDGNNVWLCDGSGLKFFIR